MIPILLSGLAAALVAGLARPLLFKGLLGTRVTRWRVALAFGLPLAIVTFLLVIERLES